MSSTDQSENDFLRKHCATELDICQNGGILKPEYTDVELVSLKNKTKLTIHMPAEPMSPQI